MRNRNGLTTVLMGTSTRNEIMIDSRPGTTKKPIPTGEQYFPQSRPEPEKRERLPSQEPAPKAPPFND